MKMKEDHFHMKDEEILKKKKQICTKVAESHNAACLAQERQQEANIAQQSSETEVKLMQAMLNNITKEADCLVPLHMLMLTSQCWQINPFNLQEFNH